METGPRTDFVPHDYQLQLLDKAVEKNVILCLGTGSGKTFISVMLVNHLLEQTRLSLHEGGKRSVFLAPTVPLAKQQGAYLKTFIAANVACYTGSDVELWDGGIWAAVFASYNVLVMTPEVFSNILNASYVKLSDINVLVLDECHAATGKSGYVQIMQNHYRDLENAQRPKILGLTASVLNRKVPPASIEKEVRDLCSRLNSNLATSLDALSHKTKAAEVIVSYRDLPLIEITVPPLVSGTLETNASYQSSLKAQVQKLLTDVGPFGTLKTMLHRIHITQHLIEAAMCEPQVMAKLQGLLEYLKAIIAIIEQWSKNVRSGCQVNPYPVVIPPDLRSILIEPIEYSFPPKIHRLLEIFRACEQLNGSLLCIVFAHERNTVFAIWCVLMMLSRRCAHRYGYIRAGFIMGQGSMSSYSDAYTKVMHFVDERQSEDNDQDVLDDFRQGRINVLIATSVIEEGVDIPKCNLVVRFNEPLNLRSYVQSRGRARAVPSIFAVMCPAGEQTKMAKHLAELKESELQVLKFCLRENVDIDDTDVEQALQDDPDLPTIYAFPERPAESAIITAQSARSTLQWYCDTLSADRFKVLRPIFRYETVQEDSSAVRVKCTVELPRESKIHEEQLSGNPLDNRVKAKISAALRACRRLYEIGELTENLVPKKRPRTDVYEWQDAEVSADVRKLFIGNTITQASTINCERDQAEQLRTHQVPKLPASAKVFVFRVRLDERNVDEFYRGRVFNAKKERVSFGVLTFVCETNSQIPNFPIFTKAGRELVHVQELNDVRVTDEQWNLIYPFHSFMLTRVLRLPGVSCDASLAPVIVPIVKCKLDYALMAKLEPGTPLPLNEMSVVTFPVKSESGGEILHSWFVGELYDMDGVPHISLMRIPKNIDFIKNRYKDKTQNRDATDKAIKERHSKPRDMCTIEPLTAPQWMKGLSVASCCHRLNRLLVAEKLRMTFVLRGIGTAYQKQATMMYERVVSNPTTRSQQTIVLNNLNFIPESGAQSKPKLRGPSVVDIYTALSPLSADDVVDSENYEVIGDAFLKLVVTLDLFRRFETEDEGYLTRQRCRMVSNMHLLTLAVPLGIHNMVESLKFSARTNFRPPGCVFETDRRELFMQQYKGKICADSVEALIGVYLEKAGGNGALDFLTGLGLPLSCAKRGSFTSRFNLRWTPPPANDIAAHSHRLCHVEAVLGYDFSNRCLLLEAITHQSYRYHRGTRSYERLEFLGDAVIDYLVSRFLYCNCPQLSPGDLTNARSAIVCNATFARVVVERDLHKHLLHHSPVLHKLTDSYLAALKKGLLDETLICEDETDDVNCVDVPKPLGDLLESLIGAVFLDCKMNFARVWEVFRRLMGDNLLKNYLVNIPRNPVAVLMEMFPRQIAFNGPQVLEDKRIRMEMTVEGEHFVAVARNKKVATKALAKKALRHFDRVKRRGQGALGPMENIANELQL